MIWQEIKNGQAVGATTAASDAGGGQAKTKSTMNENKEMFLKLLVAEMQYQDPLQPTDNSEYVKELSQFTQVETLNAVQDDVEKLAANALVGKYVSITDGETGQTIDGKVDYVYSDSGVNYVSVDGNTYKVSDITSVADSNYFEDTTMAETVENLINLLPDPDRLTLMDQEKVENVMTTLTGLSAEAQSKVSEDAVKRLTEIYNKLQEMILKQAEIDESDAAAKAAQQSGAAATEETDDAGETDAADNAANAAGETEAEASAGAGTVNDESTSETGVDASEETAASGAAGGAESTAETAGTGEAEEVSGAANVQSSETANTATRTDDKEDIAITEV